MVHWLVQFSVVVWLLLLMEVVFSANIKSRKYNSQFNGLGFQFVERGLQSSKRDFRFDEADFQSDEADFQTAKVDFRSIERDFRSIEKDFQSSESVSFESDSDSKAHDRVTKHYKFGKHKSQSSESECGESSRSVLYVWSGQATSVKNAADFVAVIDFDESSPTYGNIIKIVPLADDAAKGIAQAGNEPHHSGISSNGKYYITGGLLSFLSGHKGIFVWHIPKNPADGPKFLYALDVVSGGCTDEFLAIGGSKFLVSMMCNKNATSPGDMVYIDASLGFAQSFIKNSGPLEGFNPHGFGRLPDGTIFTADYIEPLSLTGNDTSEIIFQNTVRQFTSNGKLQRTIDIPFPTGRGLNSGVGHGDGFMELKCIPHDPLGRCYACGTSVNNMYLIGPGMKKPLPVFDAAAEVNHNIRRISSGIASMFPDGKSVLMTFQMRYIILLDIRDPLHPKILRVFDFCTDSELDHVQIKIPESTKTSTFRQLCMENSNITGTHVIVYPKGENRFIVVNYFLKFGLAQFAGTRTVHAFKLNDRRTNFTYDHRFNPNFEFSERFAKRLTFHSLKAFPHHVQYLKVKD